MKSNWVLLRSVLPKLHLATGTVLILPFFSFCQNFDFNKQCSKAYKEIFSLRLENGRTLLAEEKKHHPDNCIPLLLENYIDLLNIIASEDEDQLSSFKAGKNARLSLLKKGDGNSSWFGYAQAEINLQFALAAILFREYVSGIMELRKAYFLLEENAIRFPDFKPVKKSLFIIQALLGVIPEKYHWALKLFGLSGNLKEGMLGLKKLTNEDWGNENLLKDEAVLTYALLLLHLEGNRKEAWETVSQKFPIEGNLFTYYTAIKIAVYSYHNESALSMLEKLPEGKEYAQVPLIDYYKGLAHLQKLDTSATSDFRKFISSTKGKNLVKSAYHKIAWAYLLSGNTKEYYQYINLVKEKGITQADADKQAQKEAENDAVPNAALLKSRLLFDGGYFEKALQVLKEIPEKSLQKKQHQVELVYRQARIFDELGDTIRAIERYMVTLSKGKSEPYYYAANAALNLGLIYEAKGNFELAKEYFIECQEMDNHEYKMSLNQKAKAGLERVEELRSRQVR